jgi:hypothetical protein
MSTTNTTSRRELFVDYSRFGHSQRVWALVWPEELADLRVGQHVTVVGDTVDPATAIISAINPRSGRIDLELLD